MTDVDCPAETKRAKAGRPPILAIAAALLGILSTARAFEGCMRESTFRPECIHKDRLALPSRKNLDKHRPGAGARHQRGPSTANVYEALFQLTDAGSVEKSLASDYTVSEDGLTYTFKLQSNVTFQFGRSA